jgi:glycerol-3-phosphate O-acyltransferase / dihydroxyacetone phosphate acyltransferase
MLYSILKFLFRITLRVFFRKKHQFKPERIPESGPLIICANHPGAFLDPIVIAAVVKRKLYFLAKGSAFKGKFANWFLPKLNIIPVYRAQDDPSQMHKNQETFVRCFEHLERGGTILLFPEGVSITERKLRPLKTGAARIALGAEERNDFKLGVHIACIGLNYEDPHTFRREIYVGYSEPIRIADYKEEYKKAAFETAESVTEEIRKRLEEQMIHTMDADVDRLVAQVEKLYKQDLQKEQQIAEDDATAQFELSRRIADAVHYYRANEPERLNEVSNDISSYFWKLDELGISDSSLRSNGKIQRIWQRSIRDLLFSALGFPLYLYGLIHNYLPFILASLLSKKLTKSREFKGAIGAASGMFLFKIWYSILLICCWHYFHKYEISSHPSLLCFVYSMTWPLTGLFAWLYYRGIRSISRRWLMVSLFFRHSAVIAELIIQRKSIIRELEKAAAERVAARNK